MERLGHLCLALLIFCMSCVVHAVEEPADRITLYLTIHAPRDRPFVEELEYARKAFAPHGVNIVVADVRLLDPVSWADAKWRRSARSNFHPDGTIHVFFVGKCIDSLKDSGEPIELRGISWTAHNRKFAAVAKDAPVTTFSHELGHLLTLDHVEEDPSNIMCSCLRGPGAGFTPEQGDRMRLVFRP